MTDSGAVPHSGHVSKHFAPDVGDVLIGFRWTSIAFIVAFLTDNGH